MVNATMDSEKGPAQLQDKKPHREGGSFDPAPLRFKLLFRDYLWGGRRLGTLLGKPIGPEACYAESWELVDRPNDQSVTVEGNYSGRSLRSLLSEFPRQILGAHVLEQLPADVSFPLLVKYLDCHRVLSIQVHPDDAYASRMTPPDLGKTEAWYVLHADPGSRVYAGLKPGVTRSLLAQAVAAGHTEECMHTFQPKVGDCLFISAGTVHALGAGLVVAEIQQSSDTTFRLFDWNRTDASGNSRPLHLEQALQVTDYERGPVVPQIPQPTNDPHREQLVASPYFHLDRWRQDPHWAAENCWRFETSDRFHIVTVVRGSVEVFESQPKLGSSSTLSLRLGETALIPAASPTLFLRGSEDAVMLDAYLP